MLRPFFLRPPSRTKIPPGRYVYRCPFSNKPTLKAEEPSSKIHSRIDRVIDRLPRFLHSYVAPLRRAPLTHITSFLVLHELTAIVPLFALVATFHYSGWLPSYISQGKWVSDGVEKFGKYFRKKGWIKDGKGRRGRWWGRGEGGVRLVAEFATAYAITKALLPVRLILSLWATPWFARVVMMRGMGAIKRVFTNGGRVKVAGSGATAAGTGATGGQVVTKK